MISRAMYGTGSLGRDRLICLQGNCNHLADRISPSRESFVHLLMSRKTKVASAPPPIIIPKTPHHSLIPRPTSKQTPHSQAYPSFLARILWEHGNASPPLLGIYRTTSPTFKMICHISMNDESSSASASLTTDSERMFAP
jgi:hypothetical protein